MEKAKIASYTWVPFWDWAHSPLLLTVAARNLAQGGRSLSPQALAGLVVDVDHGGRRRVPALGPEAKLSCPLFVLREVRKVLLSHLSAVRPALGAVRSRAVAGYRHPQPSPYFVILNCKWRRQGIPPFLQLTSRLFYLRRSRQVIER